MMNDMKESFCYKTILPKFYFIRNKYRKHKGIIRYSTYSKNGEDLKINEALDFKEKGFYIDIGANKPKECNNTYHFYKKGWSGINIEPNQELIKELDIVRPRDLNLKIGVSNKKSIGRVFKFNNNLVNSTINEDIKKHFIEKDKLVLKGSEKINILTLKDIFEEYVGGNNVDFLCIDTEGNDYNILLGNDWSKYKPKVICLEAFWLNENCIEDVREPFENFLRPFGYRVYCYVNNNIIFRLKECEKEYEV